MGVRVEYQLKRNSDPQYLGHRTSEVRELEIKLSAPDHCYKMGKAYLYFQTTGRPELVDARKAGHRFNHGDTPTICLGQ